MSLGRGASSVVNSILPDTSCDKGVLNVMLRELLILHYSVTRSAAGHEGILPERQLFCCYQEDQCI